MDKEGKHTDQSAEVAVLALPEAQLRALSLRTGIAEDRVLQKDKACPAPTHFSMENTNHNSTIIVTMMMMIIIIIIIIITITTTTIISCYYSLLL